MKGFYTKMFKAFVVLTFALVFMGLFSNLQIPQTKEVTMSSTKTFTGLSCDGTAEKTSTNYNTAQSASSADQISYDKNTAFSVGQELTGIDYIILRAYIYFLSDSIPNNATITSAVLSLYVDADFSTQNFNITMQNSASYTYPHEPLEVTDYNKNFYSGNLGSKNSSTITGVGYWNITLNTSGLSWINKTGETKFCLRNYREIQAIAPTTYEYVYFQAGESANPPKLIVTYTVALSRYTVHGPYWENGAVYNGVVNLTLFKTSESPVSYLLNGSDGVADVQTIDVETVPSHFTWNISEPGLNYSRTFFLRNDLSYEELWIYLPDENQPYYVFQFDVTDMVGVSNAYLETVINVAGSSRIVERQGMNVVNQIPFVMTLAHRYTIRLICDQGTYIFGDFIPNYSELTHNLIITRSMFPESYPYLNVTVNAARKNSTLIQANYTDSESLTAWVKVDIKYRKAWTTSYTTAYTTNNTGNTHQINWNSATATTDYKVDFTASRNGTLYSWTFPCPKMLNATNIWDGFWESILGTMPFSGAQLIGSIAIMCCLGMFTYAYTDIGLIITFLLAGFLILIQWYTFSAEMWIFGFTMVILHALVKRKKEEEGRYD